MDPNLMGTLASVMSASAIGAAIAVLAGSFTAIGQGNIASRAIESIARQPEAKGSISTTMYIGLGMAETGGIYGLVIAFMLLFANPLVNRFIEVAGLGG
ncbi:MAG: ATP synthase F0 subunit C [Oscillospiraceae bacterium]|nr:ATP synthase F0 subunit C [Oscillospiraceae bacterium]